MNGGFALAFPDELVDAIAHRVVELLEERAAVAATEPEPWISAEEAAAYIGKPKSRLYDLAAQGAVPVGQDGRSRLFRKSDLDAYLLNHSLTTNGRRSHGGLASPEGDPDLNPPIPLRTERYATGAR